MDVLQNKLISPLVLALTCRAEKYTLNIDACNVKVGVLLFREQQDGTAGPNTYCPRFHNGALRACDATHRKDYVVVCVVLLHRPYLERTRFTVRINRDSLKWIFSLSHFTVMLARWRLRLYELDFDVVHQADIKSWEANALLKLAKGVKNNTDFINNITISIIDLDENENRDNRSLNSYSMSRMWPQAD